MPIIDFHTHFFPNKLMDALWSWFEEHAWPIRYKNYADDMVATLKSHGVSQCVSLHYPHKAGMAASLNDWTYQLAQNYADFIIPFGSVHPDDADRAQELEKCFNQYQFKGIKIHSHVQKVAANDPRLDAVYEVCNAHKKIVLIHCGTGPHFKEAPTKGYGYDVTTVSGVKSFAEVIKKYPDITFVVPHFGYEEIEDFVALLDDYENLYLDTAMALADFFPIKLNPQWFVHYQDRILYGSDFPNIPYAYDHEMNRLKEMKLGSEIEAKILGENAAKLLGL